MRAEPKSKTRLPVVNNMAEDRDIQGRTCKHCCVPLCNGNGSRNPELSFNQIPLNPDIRKEWIRAIRRDPGPHFTITEHTVVCSRHFKASDIKWTPVRKTLKPGSVPSIFTWTEETTPRRGIFKHPLPEKKARKELNFDEPVDNVEIDMDTSENENEDTISLTNVLCRFTIRFWNMNHSQNGYSFDKLDEIEHQFVNVYCYFEWFNSHHDLLLLDSLMLDHLDHIKTDNTQAKNHRIAELEELLKKKEEEIEGLKNKIEIERFGVQRFSHDNTLILFYTGFVSLAMFTAVFEYVKPAANSLQSYYYRACEKVNEQSSVKKQRNMLLIDEFFMFLCRLKCGLMEQDLAIRFNSHLSTVSRKIITWANFLYFALGSIDIWPSRQQVDYRMPASFKSLYPHTRVIIDCTEIITERPSSLALGSKCYSSYKSAFTWKCLVGIAPHGALSFVSNLYTGSMLDVEITKLSGLIDLLESGDSIMADKGFVLNKVLEGTGISINTPPFLMSQGQFTKHEVEKTQIIAKLRIHIERHIRRVKEYHLFDSVIPLSMVGTINQLWTVANLLTLFKGPLVREWHK